MDKEKFLELVERQALGETTEQEDLLIFKVYDQLQQGKGYGDISGSEEKLIQNRIKSKIDRRISWNKEARPFAFSRFVKIAASLALLISFTLLVFYAFQSMETTELLSQRTNLNQKATVTLADGTKVYLNTQSEIRFPKKFGKDSRMVELDGEAFFEVVPDQDRPFMIKSNGILTTVLGTSFNLNAHAGKDVVVAVQTGKVKVAALAELSKNVVLQPHQKATFRLDSKELLVGEADMDYYLDWRNKSISFNLNSLDEVLGRISRVYNIQINLKGYPENACLIKATYFNNNLYSILYGLQNLVDFEYQWLDEKTLEINYNGCKN